MLDEIENSEAHREYEHKTDEEFEEIAIEGVDHGGGKYTHSIAGFEQRKNRLSAVVAPTWYLLGGC